MNDDVGKPPPLHTCPVCGVSVGSGPVVSTSPMTGLSETIPAIEWRCKHETGGQAMSEPYQDIEQLTGPALAEAVAIKVMGWRRLGIAWLNGPHADHHAASVITFRPDLNIAQAWEVVEHRRKQGWWHAVELRSRGGRDGDWVCVVATDHESDPSGTLVMVRADTAPLAICRAALAAVEAMR